MQRPHTEFIEAGPSDAAEIARVFAEARAGMTYLPASPHTAEEDAAFFLGVIEDRDSVLTIAIGQRGEIAGFGVFGEGRLDHLYVHPECQRRGIGSRLLESAQARYVRLEGWLFEKNVEALRLYERHGFTVVERTDGSGNEEHEPDLRIAWSRTATPRDQRVDVVPYDDRWPHLFEVERELLEGPLEPYLNGGIHHVGSTAIPGLAAKPVIDILAGIEDLASSRAALAELERLDYLYAPYRAAEMHWLCKPSPARRTHHLHLVPTGSARYAAELAFRDALRADDALAREYEQLKLTLAGRHADDREAYTQAKAPFIERVLAAVARVPSERPRALPLPGPLSDGTIVLRPWSATATVALEEASTDASITRVTAVPAKYTVTAGSRFVRERLNDAREGRTVSLAVFLAQESRAVGGVNLNSIDRARGSARAGYWVVASARGRGVARRALALLTEFAFVALGLDEVELRIEPQNAASIAVALAVGYERSGTVRARPAGQEIVLDLVCYLRTR
ncbi:MAG TPA: GNAT family N-acetyltransferase [Solirubrobacteraceae bacterium]|jgi:GrpB-like predicted nucleotidyltransferase (UPF0157 family)/ribosomal protein S18 acetylase RimI-like enzyme|nr:GNAT family N-acetyltransferase [Solirubrobacteraceae bacterium]